MAFGVREEIDRPWLRFRNAKSTAKLATIAIVASLLLGGCTYGPSLVPDEQQKPIERTVVEYPPGVSLTLYARGLTAPSAIAWDFDEGEHKGSLLIGESGIGGHDPRIYGYKPDGTYFDIYPRGRLAQLPFDIGRSPFEFKAPIGGMVVSGGKIFVTHRDRDGRGVVTAFGYDGSHYTVVADLPAQGDFGVTDIAVNPTNGRLFFGLGSATNSGVVGLDNWQKGWVRDHPDACDVPYVNLKLYGYRFDTHNPLAGLFGPDDTAVTAPFQPFNVSNMTRIRKASNDKPTGAIYSVSAGGGDLRVEAHGIRYPRGLAFLDFNLYFTNDGMEMRGTRPVKDDPDVLLKWVVGTYYGFPDESANLYSVSEKRFQPPEGMIIKSGYPETSPVIDREASGLVSPEGARDSLLRATFPSLSGAARFDFVPNSPAFKDFRGNAIIALVGDHAPWATGGVKLAGPVGGKVVRTDPEVSNGAVKDFVWNTEGVPAHLVKKDAGNALERPVDVKFGADGAMYILDFGPWEVRNGRDKVPTHAGRIFRLGTPRPPSTRPVAPTAHRHSDPSDDWAQ